MSQWWHQKPQLWQWQSDGENRRWDGWYQTDQGLWQQDRRGRQCDWKAQGHEWKQGEWEDSARGSGDAAAVAAKQQETGTASVAAGEACGDAAAVAANNTFEGDWHDPDDADAYGLDETKRECDAARADPWTTWDAKQSWANWERQRREADDDGVTTEESRDVSDSISTLDDS